MQIDKSTIDTKDIQAISNRDGVAGLFLKFGYDVDRLEQSPSALGITADALIRRIEHIEQVAVQDGWLHIYLFEMKSMRVSDREALARSFRDLAGDFLLVITSDYETVDFVLLEPQLPGQSGDGGMSRKKVNLHPRLLTVNRRNPSLVALRVLRRFEYTEPDVIYQFEKLKSAYVVAEWSEPLFNNRALFSDYFLNERLPERPQWKENTTPIYMSLRKLLIDARLRLAKESENKTQVELIEPALKALDFKWEKAKAGEGATDQPDYYLYAPNLKEPVAVCLAYRWDRYLDGRRDADNTDERPVDNPSARVISVLQSGEVPYAILTNGKLWRLYSRETHSRATNYYEINLEETLEFPDRERAIKYFWLFFRQQAFEPQSMVYEGQERELSFLDELRLGSEDYAKQLGERLKDRVFDQIFPNFAGGFIEYIRQQQGEEAGFPQERLDLIYESTLTFLYRLMFLLYAEARDLLPVNDARGYAEISLKSIKEGIAKDAGNIEDQAPGRIRKTYATDSSQLYEHLQRLFAIIDKGDPEINVPRYNGGLFITEPREDSDSQETVTARFLKETSIPDQYLALGLDRFARDIDEKTLALVQIDFKSLGVRQMGSIYEGLLEFKLRIAPEKMAIVQGKRTEEVIPYAEAKKKKRQTLTEGKGANKKERGIQPGTAYLENNRQERKATGSYYTPDYIVEYIVKHTVGPALEEKFEGLRPKLREAEKRYQQHRKNAKAKSQARGKFEDPRKFWNTDEMRQLAYEALDIKVLDPAMGSGHFLVEAVDYITDRMIDFLNGFPDNPVMTMINQTRAAILEAMDDQRVSIPQERLTDTALLKRQVLKRCVYGVDLNLMAVELAKVSLWLDAFTLGAPLSFLDHHLRCGNSLIGTMAREAERQMTKSDGVQLSLFQGPFVGLLRSADIMREIGMISDATIGQSQESANMFYSFEQAAKPYKQLLDIFTLQKLGIRRAHEFLETKGASSIEALKFPDQLERPYKEMLKAREVFYGRHKFFHWDLEFPEVFIDLNKADWKKDGGFDSVVGNPPYFSISELDDRIKKYLEQEYVEVYTGNSDILYYFITLAEKLPTNSGNLAFIVARYFLEAKYAKRLRKFLAETTYLTRFVDFQNYQVFGEEVNVLTCLIFLLPGIDTEKKFKALKLTNDTLPEHTIASGLLEEDPQIFEISTNNIVKGGGSPWRFRGNRFEIDERIQNNSILLNSICSVVQSMQTGRNAVLAPSIETIKAFQMEKELVYPIAKSGSILRYEFEPLDTRLIWTEGIDITSYPNTFKYLSQFKDDLAQRYDIQKRNANWWEISTPRNAELFFGPHPRILVPFMATHNKFCVDDNKRLSDGGDLRALFFNKDSKYSEYYVCALLNSLLLDGYHKRHTKLKRGGYYEYYESQLSKLPIKKVNFDISAKNRVQNGNVVKEKYNDSAMGELIRDVEVFLHQDQTLIVHDLLAYLARTMIELNKQKQEEKKRFLSWLEFNIGTTLDMLSGRTIISNYLGDYQKDEEFLPEDELIDRLYSNKSKFSVDFTIPRIQHRVRQNYRMSLEELLPIKERLRQTDWLIDQIVYRLYNLTNEEIDLVEGRTKM